MGKNVANIGFTLAEVLITLAVIGIIAALTIPLINNINSYQNVVALQKSYLNIQQAFMMLRVDKGSFVNALSSCTWDNDHACFKNAFKEKLSFIKECNLNNGVNTGVCFPDEANIKFLNGNKVNHSYTNGNYHSGLVLSDGTSIAFELGSKTCKGTADDNTTNFCGYILVDINGLNLPNTWGKDIYAFTVSSASVLPLKGNTCKTNTDYGFSCALKYIMGN